MKRVTSLIMISFTMLLFLVGCGKSEPNVEVSKIMNDIKEIIKADMMENGMEEEQLKDRIPGYMEVNLISDEEGNFAPIELDKEIAEAGIALVQMMNVNSDEIIVLKAKDKKHVEDLKKVLEGEREKQEGIWSQYLPDQYEKVQNNIIKTNGRYLLYVTYDNPEKIEGVFDDALAK